jgi:fibronectin type 3 domain-containing protein
VTDTGYAGLAGMKNYTVELSTTLSFGNISYSNVTISTTVTVSNMIQNRYYWRVRSQDNAANYSVGWTTWVVIIDTMSPAIPVLISPADGYVASTTTITFDWGDVSPLAGVANYEIAISSTAGFSVINCSSSPAASQLTLSSISQGVWYWKIRSKNTLNKYSPWTAYRTLNVDITPPPAVTLSSPVNYVVSSMTKTTFEWLAPADNGPAGINRYVYQVSDDGFASYVIDDTTTSTSASVDLTQGTYNWRVSAIDNSSNTGPPSASWVIVIDTTQPGQPVLIEPADGVVSSSQTQLLAWSAVTDTGPAGMNYYRYQASNDGFITYAVDGTTTGTSLEIMIDQGTYTWRVYAVDRATNTAVSTTVWSITVDTTSPPSAVLMSPADGTVQESRDQTFVWSDIVDAGPAGLRDYTLELSTADSFFSVSYSTVTISTSAVITDISQNRYYWRVRTRDNASNYSVINVSWTIAIDTSIPSIPEYVSPADGYITNNPVLTIDWKDVTDSFSGITNYELMISTSPDFSVVSYSSNPAISQVTIGPVGQNYYYLKIRSKNAVNKYSPWSVVRSFSVDLTKPMTVLLSGDTLKEKEITLAWVSPGDDNNLGDITNGQYRIEYTTNPAVDWSDPVNYSVQWPTTTAPGTPQSRTITGLELGATYYFWIKTADEAINWSDVSNKKLLLSKNLPPDTPAGLTITPLNYKLLLTWINNTEPDLLGYNVYRSVKSGGPYVKVNDVVVTTNSYVDPGLGNLRYYYVITAVDMRYYESGRTVEKYCTPDTVIPKIPAGMKGVLNIDGSFTISWDSVEQNEDNTECTDLAAYHVYRANNLAGPWVQKAELDDLVLVWTDTQTTGGLLYYLVRAVNTAGQESKDSRITSSVQESSMFFVASDADAQIQAVLSVPHEDSSVLYKENNAYNENIRIEMSRKPDEEQAKDVCVYEINAVKSESNVKLDRFLFPDSNVELRLYYKTDSGGLIDKINVPAADAAGQLAIFRYNGVEWVKLGGDVDKTQQSVTIKLRTLSKYKLAQAARVPEFGVIQITPTKIFTPNNDGVNDTIEFFYENPANDSVVGKIFTVSGAFVSILDKGNTANSLVWDGKHEHADNADSGVYVYQIEAGNKKVSGTIILAR